MTKSPERRPRSEIIRATTAGEVDSISVTFDGLPPLIYVSISLR